MKIGILTHYYNTKNYGGLLQAYALVKFLRDNGFDAEQICYELDCRPYLKKEIEKNAKIDKVIPKYDFCSRLIRSIKYRYRNYKKKIYRKYNEKYLIPRYERFRIFQKAIPHSNEVFKSENISKAQGYDCYIVGSDQVWNFAYYTPVFYLEFVGSNKKKIAYAASAGKETFDKEEVQYLKKVLPTFNAISVREEGLVKTYTELVNGISPRFVVDPVFLLEANDWDKISGKRLVNDKYLFSFFLGNDDKMKNLALKYARHKHLKLVIIPFCIGFNEMDMKYGDERIHCAGPEDFVSLIKYAECVFTDSFHATAFSIIYKKKFFVFDRVNNKPMSARIRSIIKLVGCEEAFCDTEEKATMEYIIDKNYRVKNDEQLNELKKESKMFLLDELSK